MIIDIRDFNKIIESNNYFISLELNIIKRVAKYRYIFIINTIKYFY